MDFEPVSLGPAPGFATVRRRACPEPGRRGGRRPGAGAKPGNLNALKHGLRSAQFAQLGAVLASIPEARAALVALARRHQLKQRKAEEVATLLLHRIVERAQQIQHTRSNAQPPIDERRTIKRNRASAVSSPVGEAGRPRESVPKRSNARHKPH